MTDHEATYAMRALRNAVSEGTTPAEFTAEMAREVVEYVDWQREQNATARGALRECVTLMDNTRLFVAPSIRRALDAQHTDTEGTER